MILKRLTLGLFSALVVGVMLLATSSNAAGSIYRLTLSSAQLLQCGESTIEGRITLSAYDETGAVIPTFGGREVYVTNNGGYNSPANNFGSGQSHTFYLTLGVSPMLYADVYVISTENAVVRSETYRINCDGSIVNLGGAQTADVVQADDRLNFSNGDLVNVLYARSDTSGQRGIAVYNVDSSSRGVFAGFFAHELFAPYLNSPPAQNVFLGQVSYARLYALTSGEFQIVIHDPVEFKSYTIIFSAFPVSSVYFR